jgi:hypothetical protein
MIFSLLGTVVLAGVAGFFVWDRHQLCVATIEGSLRRLHATDIKIMPDWLDFDRDTLTYDVEYTDGEGRRHANRCKVAFSPGRDDEVIYWQRPLAGS